jgi:hypothetical protein
MAKIHDFLEMGQGSQNLYATQKAVRTQNKQMTAIGYVSDTADIIQASWSLFQHNDAAAFKLSERSPLPKAVPKRDVPGEPTQILKVRRRLRLNCHPIESDQDSVLESVLGTKNWLNWNGDLDNPNDSKDDCTDHDKSDIAQNNCIEALECPEQQDVPATANVSRLVRPIRKAQRYANHVLVIISKM